MFKQEGGRRRDGEGGQGGREGRAGEGSAGQGREGGQGRFASGGTALPTHMDAQRGGVQEELRGFGDLRGLHLEGGAVGLVAGGGVGWVVGSRLLAEPPQIF